MQRIVFQQDFQLSHHDHQSHIAYRFQVPKGSQAIQIHFTYGPLLETDKVKMRRALDKEGLMHDNEDEHDGFRNLLTLSLNDPYVFRGAHHYFNVDQTIDIAVDKASLGFVPGPIHTGMWELVLSCHGIFSDQVEGHIHVSVIGEFEAKQQTCPFQGTQRKGALLKDRTRSFHRNLEDYRIELHSHTTHSDASQSTLELLEAATDQGLDWLAITDHNTISAIYEAKRILDEREDLTVQLLAGIEYTTFYGHFLVHGPLHHIQKNWTGVTLDNVDDYFAQLKAKGVNITLAHPYDTGNPYCTGCRFDFPIVDYRYVDNIEVWNETNPLDRSKNLQAYKHWVDLLAQGLEINASMGRDWHRPTPNDQIPVTHVLAKPSADPATIIHALNLGRTYVTLAGKMTLWVNDAYTLGDRLPKEELEWQVDVSFEDIPDQAQTLNFYTEQGLLKQVAMTTCKSLEENSCQLALTLDMTNYRLLRLEVQNAQGQPLLFTNPIYLTK